MRSLLRSREPGTTRSSTTTGGIRLSQRDPRTRSSTTTSAISRRRFDALEHDRRRLLPRSAGARFGALEHDRRRLLPGSADGRQLRHGVRLGGLRHRSGRGSRWNARACRARLGSDRSSAEPWRQDATRPKRSDSHPRTALAAASAGAAVPSSGMDATLARGGVRSCVDQRGPGSDSDTRVAQRRSLFASMSNHMANSVICSPAIRSTATRTIVAGVIALPAIRSASSTSPSTSPTPSMSTPKT